MHSIKLQVGFAPWSCLLTAFAMVLNEDQNQLVNHDGSEIIWPNLPEPFNRRGFHIQEMIDVCWRRGKAVIQFDARPCLASHLIDDIYILNMDPVARLEPILLSTIGVLTDSLHSVAWDGKQIYDPKGKIYGIENFAFNTYYVVKSIVKDYKDEDPATTNRT